jgi:hypothetical protein
MSFCHVFNKYTSYLLAFVCLQSLCWVKIRIIYLDKEWVKMFQQFSEMVIILFDTLDI